MWRFMTLCLLLPLLAGCVTQTKGSYKSFEPLKDLTTDIPADAKANLKEGLRLYALDREKRALLKTDFWEGIAEKYVDHLAGAETPRQKMQQISDLVNAYLAYPYKTALRMEMGQHIWPQGLKNWRQKTRPRNGDPLSPLVAEERAVAVRSCPLWLDYAATPAAAIQMEDKNKLDPFLESYRNHLSEIHTFWLNVNLVMDAQLQYVSMLRIQGEQTFKDREVVLREDFPLPMDGTLRERLETLDQLLGPFPVYRSDRARFQSVALPEPWQIPREQLFAHYNNGTVGLFSWMQGREWISEGDYHPDKASRVGDVRVYRQAGRTYALLLPFYLPFPMWASAEVHEMQVSDGQVGKPKKVGGLFSFWPFYIGGQGKAFVQTQEEARFETAGVPLIYAQFEMETERGDALRLHEVLNGNLYAGGYAHEGSDQYWQRFHSFGPFSLLLHSSYGPKPEDGYKHLALGGLLWASRRGHWKQAEYHGLFWGFLGWGKNEDGQSVLRLFGLPMVME